MRIAVFSTKPYDREALDQANRTGRHELVYLEPHLTPATVALANGFEAVCPFVNDQLSAEVIARLSAGGTRLLTLRSAGFNHVDLRAAAAHGLTVTRVPAYSPHAVAEHALGLILSLNRKLHRAYARVREGNFSLEGLLGFDLHGKTVAVVGTGRIGTALCRILAGLPHPGARSVTEPGGACRRCPLHRAGRAVARCPDRLAPSASHAHHAPSCR